MGGMRSFYIAVQEHSKAQHFNNIQLGKYGYRTNSRSYVEAPRAVALIAARRERMQSRP
jgi:hypothetical protein